MIVGVIASFGGSFTIIGGVNCFMEGLGADLSKPVRFPARRRHRLRLPLSASAGPRKA